MAAPQREGPEHAGPGVPYPGIALVVAILVSAILVQELPLKTSRPTVTEQPKYQHLAVEDVAARLWQDPFSAVDWHQEEKAEKRSKKAPSGTAQHPLHHDPDRLFDNRLKKAKETHITVLGVMVFGGPYPEVVEERRRVRYAVLSGLRVSGFVPENPDYIGYFQTSVKLDNDRADSKLDQIIVPYEWLELNELAAPTTNAPSADQILLLWLNDDVFAIEGQPLARIAQLIEKIAQSRSPQPENVGQLAPPRLEFKIIGPAGSTNLKAMINEVSTNKFCISPTDYPKSSEKINISQVKWKFCAICHLRDVEFYSAKATADDELLLGEGHKNEKVPGFFKKNGITLFRTIGTDKQLAEQLVKELRLCGTDLVCRDTTDDCYNKENPDYCGHLHHVALISEWDTFYGRSLPETMFRLAEPSSDSPHPEEHLCKPAPWIHRFSYLRGLDGQVPGISNANGTSPANNDQKSDERYEAQSRKRPFGRSQFDYLRRIAMKISQLNQELKRAGSGEIKAIGILGSDVYDKLLVLQALRQSLPRILFFTTDLDAQLLDPREWQWTRNLLVASSFGLALAPALQADLPPFRSNYQTSTYFATLLALDTVRNKDKNNLDKLEKAEISDWLQPTMYEVARSGTFELPTGTKNHNKLCFSLLESSPKCIQSIYPTTPKLYPDLSMKVTLASLFTGTLAVALLYLSSWTLQQWKRTFRRFIYLSVTLVGMGVVAVWFHDGHNAEPFVLTEGVSIWPSVLLRLSAGILSVFFLVKIHYDSDKSESTKKFFPGQRPGKFRPPRLIDRLLLAWRSRLRRAKKFKNIFYQISVYRWNKRTKGSIDAVRLWREYNHRCSFWRRFWRVLPMTILYISFGVSLMYIFGFPHIPYRGAVSWWIYVGVLSASVFLLIFLIFYIVDSIRLCATWIELLTKDKTIWPVETLEKCQEELKLSPECLADWLDIQLIRERTEKVGQRIYYPFIVLFVTVSALNPGFDNWQIPIGLVIIITINVMYAVWCAICLRLKTEKSRSAAIDRLTLQLINAHAEGKKDLAEQLEIVIREIRSLRQGAFAPYGQQPFLRAVLLFLGGYGGLVLIQYLTLLDL